MQLVNLKIRIMKKLLFFALIAMFLSSFSGLEASNPDKDKNSRKELRKIEKEKQKHELSEAEVYTMLSRLEEIQNMDLKSLPSDQKRDLRKEVRDIRKKLDDNADGFSIYIGGGALLVIIVLLILLL